MSHRAFVGRAWELEKLRGLLEKKTSSFVVLQGRRRIGKSRLIEEFATGLRFIRFAGLPPTPKTTAQDQRNQFAREFREQFGFAPPSNTDWGDLFTSVAKETASGRVVVLLDEVSWMAHDDETYPGKLKSAWDTHFKHNSDLILIVCGSVSAWIERKILHSTGYVGRVSYALRLKELSLASCNELFAKMGARYSAYEKFMFLSITGGIPRYLEEIRPNLTAEEMIRQMCFESGGLLFREFDAIFSNTLSKRHESYRKIVTLLRDRCLSYSEICTGMGVQKSSHVLEWLDELVLAGYLARDYNWSIRSGKESSLSRYRMADNYIRFYLKYIEPNEGKIQRGHYQDLSMTSFPGWSGLLGLQFENLVLNNRAWILNRLHLRPEDVIADNPYFQRESATKSGCQIDYLIQTRFKTLFVCEVKFSRNPVPLSVVNEVQEKIRRLKAPRGVACNPVLIHAGEVSDAVIDSGYFAAIIDITEPLTP